MNRPEQEIIKEAIFDAALNAIEECENMIKESRYIMSADKREELILSKIDDYKKVLRRKFNS